MAAPTNKQKVSRAIIQEALRWRALLDELPLLAEVDSLEGARDKIEAQVNELTRREAVVRASLGKMEVEEFTRRHEVEQAARASAEAAATALHEAQTALENAREQATRIVAEANTEADEIRGSAASASRSMREKAAAAADKYRASMSDEVTALEARVTALREEEARLTTALGDTQRTIKELHANMAGVLTG